MLGAIIGDIAGSYEEVLNIKNKSRSYLEKTAIMNREVPLFTDFSSVTDDSILTTAIADAILNNKSYEDALREYGLKEINLGVDRYGRSRFGKGFVNWLYDSSKNNSFGNGCAMRISPVGFLFNNLEQVKEESKKATIKTHNHEESIKCAEAVSVSIYLLRIGYTKEMLKKYVEDNYFKLDFDIDDLRENYKFTSRAINSVPQAIFCFLKSIDFEDAIRKAISIGGDSDTIACITGALAEAYYGVPVYLKEQAIPYLKDYMIDIIDKFYNTNILLKNTKIKIKN